MSILTLFLWLIVIGVGVWAITKFIPMSPEIAMMIRATGVVIALIMILSAFGVLDKLRSVEVPSLK